MLDATIKHIFQYTLLSACLFCSFSCGNSKQAEDSEKAVYRNPDSLEELRIDNRIIRIRKSQKKRLLHEIENEYMRWLEWQEYELSSQDYLKLLVGVKEKMDRNEMIWQQP